MSQNKIDELLLDYRNSLKRLEESLGEDLSISSTILDGTIQRFEFTFELAWKFLRAILVYRGIDVNSPRNTIKEAFREKLIQDGEAWIEMLEDRNSTSHTYDEILAKEIYSKVKNNHFIYLKKLEKIDVSEI